MTARAKGTCSTCEGLCGNGTTMNAPAGELWSADGKHQYPCRRLSKNKKRLIPLLKISSPLAKLVLFMFCLAILGSAVATLHYAAVDLPQQKASPPPENSNKLSKCGICTSNCLFQPDYYKCLNECDLIC